MQQLFTSFFPLNYFILTFLLSGCLTGRQHKIEKAFDRYIQSKGLDAAFTGFVLYDPEKKKRIISINGDKYFTPASNLKIFTLYAGLKCLGDSLPALRYHISGDSLIFQGMGDPTFLTDSDRDSVILEFLRSRNEQLFFSSDNFQDDRYSPGWSWDDYSAGYMVEKAAFPVYGNSVSIEVTPNDTTRKVCPEHMDQIFSKVDSPKSLKTNFKRALHTNRIRYHIEKDTAGYQAEIPFIYSDSVLINILKKIYNIDVTSLSISDGIDHWSLLKSYPVDSIYRKMMLESDNFLAEQILLMCSGLKTDTLNTSLAIQYVSENYLTALPDTIRWVDGSGLSRYNLLTPRTLVYVLKKLYHEFNHYRLFRLFPVGGNTGTIAEWFDPQMNYLKAKSGSLSNNLNLSGYITTKSGKLLIFSLMTNHFMIVPEEVKEGFKELLATIYEKY